MGCAPCTPLRAPLGPCMRDPQQGTKVNLETGGRESPAMAWSVQSCAGLSPANLAELAR